METRDGMPRNGEARDSPTRIRVPINIRVTLADHEVWKALADREKRTLAAFVRHAVKAYVKAVGR